MEINLKNKKKALANINKLFNGRIDGIKFVDDYGPMILENQKKKKAAEEEPKPEAAKTKTKTKREKSSFELHEKFINQIKSDKKNINEQLFKEYFFIILHCF